VERIIARNNLPKPNIAVINTRMPNAFATGRSPKSSVVAVTTGL
jgi:heat shock protein HtpX